MSCETVRDRLTFAFAVVLGLVFIPPAMSQAPDEDIVVPSPLDAHMGPASHAAQQIAAEALYILAYGDMQKDLAEARFRHAEARRLEESNKTYALREHFKRADMREAARDKKIGKAFGDIHRRHDKILERIMNHPELNYDIVTGTPLNFLKNRLTPTMVTSRTQSGAEHSVMLDVASKLHVTPEILRSLQVRQNLPRGESFVFRLGEGQAMQVEWWPPALRALELKKVKAEFEQARAAVMKSTNEQEFEAAMRRLIIAHAKLEEDFLEGQTHEKRTKSVHACNAYTDAKVFLRALAKEIRRMETLGPGQATPQALAFKGEELPELLSHMVRNGLEFMPAKPGDEPAYHQVFQMLRDLYVAVEADAEEKEEPTDAMIPPPPTRLPLEKK